MSFNVYPSLSSGVSAPSNPPVYRPASSSYPGGLNPSTGSPYFGILNTTHQLPESPHQLLQQSQQQAQQQPNGPVGLASYQYSQSQNSAQLPIMHSDEKVKPVLSQRPMIDSQIQSPQAMSMGSSSLVGTFAQPLQMIAHQSQPPSPQSMQPQAASPTGEPLSPGGSTSRSAIRTLANSKRAAQNRAAQRAFRQRKERYMKDLESKAKELDTTKKQLETLQKEKQEMVAYIGRLKREISRLKGESDASDDDSHHRSSSGSSSSSPFTPGEDDQNGLGEEPWKRKSDSGHKDLSLFDDRSGSLTNNPALNRPGSGLTDTPARGSGEMLPHGLNAPDTSVEPFFRPDYNRHVSLGDNRGVYGGSSGGPRVNVHDEDTDRVMDDLCELLRTRSRPTLPHTLGMTTWQPPHANPPVAAANGSAVAG